MRKIVDGKEILLLAMVLLAGACTRRDLNLADPSVQLLLNVHDTLPLAGPVPSGELYETRLYDASTGTLAETAYTGPKGGPIYAAADSYRLVISNFDTETVVYDGEESLLQLRAVTNMASIVTNRLFWNLVELASVKAGTPSFFSEVVGEPGYVFAAVPERIDLPYRAGGDDGFVITADAWPLVKACRLEVRGVTGQENLASAVAFLTGVVRGRYLETGDPVSGSATMTFGLDKDEDRSQLEACFSTFGFAEGESVWLYLLLTDTGGGRYLFTYDVTGQCDMAVRELTIGVDLEYEVPEPSQGGGGFFPAADDWEIQGYPVQI